jgi:hypothetical protein
VRAHIRSFYDEVIEPLPVIEQGHLLLPTTPGLGVRLKPDWFDGKEPTHRVSR